MSDIGGNPLGLRNRSRRELCVESCVELTGADYRIAEPLPRP